MRKPGTSEERMEEFLFAQPGPKDAMQTRVRFQNLNAGTTTSFLGATLKQIEAAEHHAVVERFQHEMHSHRSHAVVAAFSVTKAAVDPFAAASCVISAVKMAAHHHHTRHHHHHHGHGHHGHGHHGHGHHGHHAHKHHGHEDHAVPKAHGRKHRAHTSGTGGSAELGASHIAQLGRHSPFAQMDQINPVHTVAPFAYAGEQTEPLPVVVQSTVNPMEEQPDAAVDLTQTDASNTPVSSIDPAPPAKAGLLSRLSGGGKLMMQKLHGAGEGVTGRLGRAISPVVESQTFQRGAHLADKALNNIPVMGTVAGLYTHLTLSTAKYLPLDDLPALASDPNTLKAAIYSAVALSAAGTTTHLIREGVSRLHRRWEQTEIDRTAGDAPFDVRHQDYREAWARFDGPPPDGTVTASWQVREDGSLQQMFRKLENAAQPEVPARAPLNDLVINPLPKVPEKAGPQQATAPRKP